MQHKNCSILLFRNKLYCCLFLLQLVKEQKGRISELSKAKSEQSVEYRVGYDRANLKKIKK